MPLMDYGVLIDEGWVPHLPLLLRLRTTDADLADNSFLLVCEKERHFSRLIWVHGDTGGAQPVTALMPIPNEKLDLFLAQKDRAGKLSLLKQAGTEAR